MKTIAKTLAALTAAICILSTPVRAQGEGGLNLSQTEEQALYETLSKKRVKAPPAGMSMDVGARVPRSVALYNVPKRAQPAPVRRYRYTVAENRVVLVDPLNRQIVRILGVAF